MESKKTHRAGEDRVLERYNALKLGWLNDSLFFLLLIAVFFILFRFVIGLAIVGGESMSPTLADGEVVVYSRIGKDYQPGDIISMRVPAGEYYVKRVVAVGGDVVDIRDGEVYVNDMLLDERWSYGQTEREAKTILFPYTVREGNVFVLGDNREVSMDSRMFGEVNLRQIKGKILYHITLKGAGGPVKKVDYEK